MYKKSTTNTNSAFFRKKKPVLKDNDDNQMCCHNEKDCNNTLELIPHFKMVAPAKCVYICKECGEIFEIIKK